MRRPHPALHLARLAAGALLVLGLAACGDDEPADTTEPGSSDSPEPAATTSQEPSASSTPKPRPRPAESPDEVVIDVTVQGDRISPNAEVVEVEVGEPITLEITSDRPGELHIHTSPEQYVEFGSGTATETFRVERPGSVEVEEHETGAQVLRVLAE